MNPWVKTTATLLIGFLLGIAATGLALPHFFHPHHHPGLADADRILKKLSSKLNLTQDQKTKAELLLKQNLPKGDALRREDEAKFDALRSAFNTQLRAILNPDQQKKLDDMVAKWENREKEDGHSFGCGPMGPTPTVAGK